MSYYDKHAQVGYDEVDKATNMQNRVHDGILQRLKEDGAKKCWQYIVQLEKCVNTTAIPLQGRCGPYQKALNQCYHDVHTEEAYQQYRIKYLRGELAKLNSQRVAARVEGMKAAHPGHSAYWKADYTDKLVRHYNAVGSEPLASENVIHDDLKDSQEGRDL